MDRTNDFEQFLKQLSDLQIGFFNNWVSTAPRMQRFNLLNFRETFDNTMRLQEEVVTSSLEFQALLSRLSIETQKQFWESYFNMFRRS